MVHLRFTSFILMLMFTLLEARDSTYKHHNYQGKFDAKMVPHRLDHVIGSSKPSIVKDTTFHILEAKRESNDMNPKGRKLGRKGGSERTKAREGAKGAGANPSDIRNCNTKGKGKSNHVLLCKQSKANTMNGEAGFVALSADYHYPKSHPPKHN